MAFFDDLARWEAGELSLDQLREAHPNEDVSGLTQMFQEMSDLPAPSPPAPEPLWDEISSRLTSQSEADGPAKLDLRRLAVAAAILGILASLPGGPARPVRETIVRFVKMVNPFDAPPAPAPPLPVPSLPVPSLPVPADRPVPRATQGDPSGEEDGDRSERNSGERSGRPSREATESLEPDEPSGDEGPVSAGGGSSDPGSSGEADNEIAPPGTEGEGSAEASYDG